ncbi:hypothetical protein ACHAXM_003075 [Skeletonema potamos]
MITELESAKIIPRDQWFDGEALRMRVAFVSNNHELRQICDACNDFNPKERAYIGSYRQFVEMKKGDIIVLHTKGCYTKNGPPQTLSFGVIEDNSLTTMTKKLLRGSVHWIYLVCVVQIAPKVQKRGLASW